MMIKVPRAKQMAYAYLPWSQVVAAAERGDDGLEIRGPHFTPNRQEAPRRESYEIADRSIDEARYEKDMAKWESDRDVCFFREGVNSFESDKTLLFQQNW